MLQHLFCMGIRNQKGYIVALEMSVRLFILPTHYSYVRTLTGFLRKMKNASALCVKNLVNLWTKMFSISSACLILMLTRTLLILGSIKTFSFSLRETVKGLRRTSGELAASTSGTLCRSEVWDAKFESERAAVRDDRTQRR